ncbi:MAG: DUF5706 domain-containing protein [Candidatus Manganitrophus sp.]|nr:MAG: DUF5706 domain-containing protein [Candidatus Manganitrophus sp.]
MKNHNDNQNRLDLLESSLARNLAWVAAADSKVPSIFAIDMAMLGIWCALAPKVHDWPVYTAILSAFAVLALLASILSLVLVVFPRLSGPKGSAVFFGGIVQHSEEAFLKKISGGISEEILDDLARQTYRNAEIAKDKFMHVRWAMICMFTSAPFWLASIALLYAAR